MRFVKGRFMIILGSLAGGMPAYVGGIADQFFCMPEKKRGFCSLPAYNELLLRGATHR
jgi:hypothetical protein